MEKKSINKDYKETVTLRFLEAMRRVLMARKEGCKTMKQFAEFVGEHQQNISKMERGERMPTVEQICRLCEVFGFSPAWVLLGRGNMEETAELGAAIAVLQERMTKIEIEIEQMKARKK